MALEISEIAIQMQVDDEDRGPGERSEGGGAHCGLDKQEIVGECVRRVLKMLKDTRER